MNAWRHKTVLSYRSDVNHLRCHKVFIWRGCVYIQMGQIATLLPESPLGGEAVKFQASVHSRPNRRGNCANKTNHNFSERSHNVCLVQLGPLTTRSISLTPLRNFKDHQAPGRQTRGRRGTRKRQSGFAKSICVIVIVVMPTE